MKKLFVIMMALTMMIMLSSCGLFTEKQYSYNISEDGSKTLTDIYTYDSNGYMTEHYIIADG